MKQVKIKILLVINSSIKDLERLRLAFDKMKADYEAGTDGLVTLERHEYVDYHDSYPFEEYWGDNWGLNRGWINSVTKSIKETSDYKTTDYKYMDSVMFCIPDSKWSREGNQNVYGWSMGSFFNGFQVQQIRVDAEKSDRWLYLTMLMELSHSWDSFIEKELGVDLDKVFGVKDFDKDIIHDQVRFYAGYRAELRIVKNYLHRVFARREAMINKIKILEKIINLYRLLIFKLKRKRDEPVLKDELME